MVAVCANIGGVGVGGFGEPKTFGDSVEESVCKDKFKVAGRDWNRYVELSKKGLVARGLMVAVVVVVVSKEFGSVIAVELADDKEVFIKRGIEVGGGLFFVYSNVSLHLHWTCSIAMCYLNYSWGI